MELYTRADSKKWWMAFTVNGKRTRKSTGAPIEHKDVAYRVMAEAFQKAMNRELLGGKDDIPVADAFDMAIARAPSASTKRSYTLTKRRLLGLDNFDEVWSIPENSLMTDITTKTVEEMKANRSGEGLKNNTVNMEIRNLRVAYNIAADEFNVVPGVKFKMMKAFSKSRYLSDQEEAAVIEYLEFYAGNPSYDKALQLFIFLVDTGARLEEALSIEWSDINLSLRRIEIYRGKTESLSLVPIYPRNAEMLNKLHNQKRPFMKMSRAVRLLRKAIAEVCNDNERVIRQRGTATIHSLRDTFATRLIQKGMKLQNIGKLMGHSHATMTAKYAHLETGDVLEEAQRLMAG